MSFINPIWLYGLLGLSIPLLIHLWSKKEGKTIKVGSIQFFPESETRQSSKLHLNEIFLLILRSLIVALLVMLIAQPILISSKKRDRTTVLIAPNLLQDEQIGAVLDTILSGDYNVKLLTAGLPDYDADQTIHETDGDEYWQLMPEIENLASDEIIVFANNSLASFKGKVPTSSKQLNWYAIPPKNKVFQVLKATVFEGEYHVLLGEFGEMETKVDRLTFTSQNEVDNLQFRSDNGALQLKHISQENWVTIDEAELTNVSINYDEEFLVDAQLLAAAFRAIHETNGIPIQVDLVLISTEESASTNAEIQVWLTNKEVVYSNQGKTLIYSNIIYENSLIKLADLSNQYWLTRRLTVANMTTDDLPEELVQNLFQDDELNEQISALDQRTIAAQMIKPISVAAGTNGAKEQLAIPHYYWIIFMSLMAIERFVSSKRKQ